MNQHILKLLDQFGQVQITFGLKATGDGTIIRALTNIKMDVGKHPKEEEITIKVIGTNRLEDSNGKKDDAKKITYLN